MIYTYVSPEKFGDLIVGLTDVWPGPFCHSVPNSVPFFWFFPLSRRDFHTALCC
jgi:hypothetical protein